MTDKEHAEWIRDAREGLETAYAHLADTIETASQAGLVVSARFTLKHPKDPDAGVATGVIDPGVRFHVQVDAHRKIL